MLGLFSEAGSSRVSWSRSISNTDTQPVQVHLNPSMDQHALVENKERVARIAGLYQLPSVLATINVTSSVNQPTIRKFVRYWSMLNSSAGRPSTPGKMSSSAPR